MNGHGQNLVARILIWLIPGILAITLHELAHGWVAMRLGDPTARDEGRLTLNPLRHIDPVGTLVVPALLLLARAPFVFGWAKPVPVNFQRLRGGRWGTLLVASAGVTANALMLSFWLVVERFIGAYAPTGILLTGLFHNMAVAGVAMNLALIVFNLIPILPLDGGRILGALLPRALSDPYMRLERYGFFILIVLLATGVLGRFFNPVMDYFLSRF
jgi:Zn-dependent protease